VARAVTRDLDGNEERAERYMGAAAGAVSDLETERREGQPHELRDGEEEREGDGRQVYNRPLEISYARSHATIRGNTASSGAVLPTSS
jgi:hypothetical protein